MGVGSVLSVSDVMAGYLKGAGVRHVFGYPGDPSVEVIESLRRNDIDFVLARREGTAALMAQAYGQLTGRPGTCLSTLGPGSSNLVNGIASAFLDKVPMIAISGQIETKRVATFTHQVLDHALLFSSITKYHAEVRPTNIGGVMRRVLRTATAGRPGPVHLTTPADVVGAPAVDAEIMIPPLVAQHGVPLFHGEVGAPAALIAKARKPVVVAGIGAVNNACGKALVRFAETVGAAVVVAPMAKGIFPEDHDLFAGTLDMACNDLMWNFLDQSDLIIAAGFDAVELIKPWRPSAPVIHIDTTENTDQIYFAETEIVGEIGGALTQLADGFKGQQKWNASDVTRHRKSLFGAYEAGRVSGRLNPTDVVRAVREALPADTIATVDVGSHKLLVGQGWKTPSPRGLLMTNGLSSMGFSVPAAIAAALIDTRPVVSFVGDGGFAMVEGELRLAASRKLPMRIVVFCDNSLNRIELKQAARQYPPVGTRLDSVDVAAVARAQGCEGVTVSSQGELEKALAQPPQDRPLVIAAVIDPTQYQAQF